MEDLKFNITINASREHVWKALWEDKNYREWASAFAEGSWAKTDWKKGSKVFFLDSTNDGMSSLIAENIPNEFMSIEHRGAVEKGVEYFDRPQDKEWQGVHENYTLKSVGDKTELTIDLESKGIDAKMIEYFKETWPKALDKLKAIAERDVAQGA